MASWDDFVDRRPRLAAAIDWIRQFVPPLNFITVHYLYFIVVSLVTSIIFYGSSDPKWSISYVDSLFLVISAMTEAGLNTVNLSQMTSWQQVLLWLLIILGSSIWVSIWTIFARIHFFEKRFDDVVKKARSRQLKAPSLDRRKYTTKDLPIVQKLRTLRNGRRAASTDEEAAGSDSNSGAVSTGSSVRNRNLIISAPVAMQRISPAMIPTTSESGSVSPNTEAVVDATQDQAPEARKHSSEGREESTTPARGNERIAFAADDRPPRPDGAQEIFRPNLRRNASSYKDKEARSSGKRSDFPEHHQFLTAQKVGRNAQFHDLSTEEREILGGTEYRALRVLAVLVPVYFFVWQFLGCIALGAWINNYLPGPAQDNAVSPWWNGIFNGVSAFNNSGMSVLDANMVAYDEAYFVLIVMGAMILAGNTAYPLFLRLWLWCLLHLLKLFTYPGSFVELKHTLHYILKYPRRVYTNLFPARATWWLLFMLIVLNGTDWAAYEILNLGNPLLDQTPVNFRVIDGLFQALAVRSGGFYVVPIPNLYIGLQVLYVIMMYISVYPVVITMRHSNVYEERSLGIYEDEDDKDSNEQNGELRVGRPARKPTAIGLALRRTFSQWEGVGAAAKKNSPETRVSFINHQIRGQLSHDLWWLVVAILLISIIETEHFLSDPATYSVFNIIFEVVSAYGCVGISVGLPNVAYSFSGGWYAGSKLILCLVMLRGRHRGLPVALDRAVRLPGDGLEKDEEEDHQIRRSMSMRPPSRDMGNGVLS